MTVTEVKTGNEIPIEIRRVEAFEYRNISKSRYFFDWAEEKEFEVYKLTIVGSSDILGLISIERMPYEWRIHVRLLTVSAENKGNAKQFEKIAGNLIVHAAKIAVIEYAELACVSLRPKTQIAQHYVDQYKMSGTGATLSIMAPEILDLINEYDHDSKRK